MPPKKKVVTELTTIPPRKEVDEFIQASIGEAEQVLAFLEQVTITQSAEREFASNALAEVAQRHDIIDKKRLSWVGPLKAVTSDIDATFRPVTAALKRATEILKAKIGAYDVAQAQERDRLLKASAAALTQGQTSVAMDAYVQAEQHVAADTGASSKIEWTGEVLDAALIPREYLMPNVAKLEAFTKALGTDPAIPGWRAFQVAAVRTSRRGSA
jgi:hypothetical protein